MDQNNNTHDGGKMLSILLALIVGFLIGWMLHSSMSKISDQAINTENNTTETQIYDSLKKVMSTAIAYGKSFNQKLNTEGTQGIKEDISVDKQVSGGDACYDLCWAACDQTYPIPPSSDQDFRACVRVCTMFCNGSAI